MPNHKGKPRFRTACPNCGALSISKRTRMNIYHCNRCQHNFKTPITVFR